MLKATFYILIVHLAIAYCCSQMYTKDYTPGKLNVTSTAGLVLISLTPPSDTNKPYLEDYLVANIATGTIGKNKKTKPIYEEGLPMQSANYDAAYTQLNETYAHFRVWQLGTVNATVVDRIIPMSDPNYVWFASYDLSRAYLIYTNSSSTILRIMSFLSSDPSTDTLEVVFLPMFDNTSPVQVYQSQIAYFTAVCCLCISGYTFKFTETDLTQLVNQFPFIDKRIETFYWIESSSTESYTLKSLNYQTLVANTPINFNQVQVNHWVDGASNTRNMALIIALIFVVAALILTCMLIYRNRWKLRAWWHRAQFPWRKNQQFDMIQDSDATKPLHA